MKRHLLPYLSVVLLLAQVALVLVSWIWSAAVPDGPVRSMLSSEGIRWFMGGFSSMLSTPWLTDLVLAGIAYGCVRRCAVLSFQGSYRERWALLLSAGLLMVEVGAMALLTLWPHAVLLSATGRLFPSPFFYSLPAVIAFCLTSCSVLYGVAAERFQSVADVYMAVIDGIRSVAPWLFFYLLFVQFYGSLWFVFA